MVTKRFKPWNIKVYQPWPLTPLLVQRYVQSLPSVVKCLLVSQKGTFDDFMLAFYHNRSCSLVEDCNLWHYLKSKQMLTPPLLPSSLPPFFPPSLQPFSLPSGYAIYAMKTLEWVCICRASYNLPKKSFHDHFFFFGLLSDTNSGNYYVSVGSLNTYI